MDYPKIPLAQSILQICLAKGVTRIVISPGSRNAPLTIGFASNPEFECYSIADERCAGFFALGLAQQTKSPVALLCTSGSAVLNYYPAVAEAFYSQIPLVVISADRPSSKIDIGDGQTIRQHNVIKQHTVFSGSLTEEASEANDLIINKAIDRAVYKKGPVHLNAPFEEPLYETVSKPTVDAMIQRKVKKTGRLSVKDIMAVTNVWNVSKKKMILIGTLPPGSIPAHVLDNWAADPSVVVLTEVTSNIHHPGFVSRIDTLITPFRSRDFKAFQPEVLVTFGGMVVSKRIKAFLRKYQPEQHWHVDPLRAYDTFGCLTRHFRVEPGLFFQAVEGFSVKVKSSYSARVDQWLKYREEKHQSYLAAAPFSDFTVYAKLLSAIPSNQLVHFSNSAAIRYAQLFPLDRSAEVWCNRGTSGIDGSSSTAIGASVHSGKPTVLISGDISFFYDSNALWNQYIPKNFKIIVVNNSGGGIFRILPGHSETPVFNRFFETSHHLSAEHLAAMFGFSYLKAKDPESLEVALNDFFTSEGKSILEVFTPEKENDKVLKAYFRNLA